VASHLVARSDSTTAPPTIALSTRDSGPWANTTQRLNEQGKRAQSKLTRAGPESEKEEEVGPFTPAENVIAHLGGRRAETNGGGRERSSRGISLLVIAGSFEREGGEGATNPNPNFASPTPIDRRAEPGRAAPGFPSSPPPPPSDPIPLLLRLRYRAVPRQRNPQLGIILPSRA
jgi:hypothetical protein